jgi:hypothetical protein
MKVAWRPVTNDGSVDFIGPNRCRRALARPDFLNILAMPNPEGLGRKAFRIDHFTWTSQRMFRISRCGGRIFSAAGCPVKADG